MLCHDFTKTFRSTDDFVTSTEENETHTSVAKPFVRVQCVIIRTEFPAQYVISSSITVERVVYQVTFGHDRGLTSPNMYFDVLGAVIVLLNTRVRPSVGLIFCSTVRDDCSVCFANIFTHGLSSTRTGGTRGTVEMLSTRYRYVLGVTLTRTGPTQTRSVKYVLRRWRTIRRV